MPFFLAGAKDDVCFTTGLVVSFISDYEQLSSKETGSFYSANQEEYRLQLPELFERSSGTLQVTYKARVAGGTLSTTTKLTLKCVGPIAGVTPVSPAPNAFVFDEGRTPLEFQIGNGCQADNVVLTVNGNRTVVPNTGSTLVARHDTAITWSAHMEDILGTPGEVSEPETFYTCPRMSFVSHSNQSVAVRVEEERTTEVALAWPQFEWEDAPVCGQAADTLNAVKYRLTVKDGSGAESVSTVSSRNATLTLLPGTYEVKFEVVVGGTALKHSEKWSVRVYLPTPQEDSDKGGLSKGAVTGIAVGCSVAGVALIVGLVLLIVFLVRRYGKKKADEAAAETQASLQKTMGQPAGSVFLVDPSMVMMDQMGGMPVVVDPTVAVPAPPTPNGSQEMSQSSFPQSQQSLQSQSQQQANTTSLEQQQQMAMMMMMMMSQQQQQQSSFPMTDSTMVSPPQ